MAASTIEAAVRHSQASPRASSQAVRTMAKPWVSHIAPPDIGNPAPIVCMVAAQWAINPLPW